MPQTSANAGSHLNFVPNDPASCYKLSGMVLVGCLYWGCLLQHPGWTGRYLSQLAVARSTCSRCSQNLHQETFQSIIVPCLTMTGLQFAQVLHSPPQYQQPYIVSVDDQQTTIVTPQSSIVLVAVHCLSGRSVDNYNFAQGSVAKSSLQCYIVTT